MTRKEMNKYIRLNSTPKGEKGKCRCALCNSKKDIQWHHVIPVSSLTHMCWYRDYDSKEQLDTIYTPREFLCNDCHQLFHSLMEDNYNEPELDLEIISGVVDIISKIDLTKAPEELYEDYASIVDEMTETMVHNFIKYGDLTKEEANQLEEIMRENIFNTSDELE